MKLQWAATIKKKGLFLMSMVLLLACAHQQDTGSVKTLWLQANLASYERQYDEALTLLQAATKKDPDFAPAWLSKGMVYKRLGNEKLSKKCYEVSALLYQKKHAYDPDDIDYIKGYAEALSLLGYKQKAMKVLDEAIAKFPREKNLISFQAVIKRPNPLGFNQSKTLTP